MQAEWTCRAAAYTLERELNYEAVVLADDQDAPKRQVEIQQSLTHDEQDRVQGMDSHCVVLPSGATAYGCLEGIKLSRDQLELRFRQESVAALGLTDVSLQIPLELSSRALRVTGKGLQAMFRGDDTVAISIVGIATNDL